MNHFLEPGQISYNSNAASPGLRSSRPLAITKGRKDMEANAKSVANRLFILKKEEENLWKSIELAKMKTKEAYMSKLKDAERAQERHYVLQDVNGANIQTYNPHSQQLRKDREDHIKDLRESIQKQKYQDMLRVRKQSEDFRLRKIDWEDRLLQKNQNQMMSVKIDEMLGKFNRKEFFENKLEKIKLGHKQRIQDEAEFRITKELEMLDFRRAEINMVQRIRETRNYHDQVNKALESVKAEHIDFGVDQQKPPKPQLPNPRGSSPLGSPPLRASSVKEAHDRRIKLQNNIMTPDHGVVRAKSVKRTSFQ